MHWLTDPFQAEFMRRAFLAAIIIGVVYIVAGEVIAAGRVHTDALEYRLGEHELERVEPEPAIAAAVVKAARLLGLTFAGVDVRVFDDGFAVHGLNPSPMFTGFDRLAGTDVAERLADHLARPGRTR